jgi:mannose/fructose/N-acetylgalactosamine-specific phosphotransferase system component IIC
MVAVGCAELVVTLVAAAAVAVGDASTTVVVRGANDEVVAIGAAVTGGAALPDAAGPKADSAVGVAVAT